MQVSEQAREAFAGVYAANAPKYAQQALSGDFDETPLMQAFARFEAAARADERAKALREAADNCPECDGTGFYLFGLKQKSVEVPCVFCEFARASLNLENKHG